MQNLTEPPPDLRCPDYAMVPAGCVSVQDPDDTCCIKPKCADPNVIPIPHFQPYTTNNKPVAPPADKDRSVLVVASYFFLFYFSFLFYYSFFFFFSFFFVSFFLS